MRWRRDDRPAPDDRRDDGDDAENWLSEFRGQSVRPDALTAADRDAGGRRAAQVGSHLGPGESADLYPAREDRPHRPPDSPHREADRGARQPAPRPGPPRPDRADPPRADLERDVGPWAGVQHASDPDSSGRDRWIARRRDQAGWPGLSGSVRRRIRTSADEPDTDRFGRQAGDRAASDDRRRDPNTADPGSPSGDRRAAGAVRPDRAGRPPGPDALRPDEGRGAASARPDWRRRGPDVLGHQGYDESRPDRWSQPGRDDDRGRVVPQGHGADGQARSPGPQPPAARPSEQAPRRDLPAWLDGGRQSPARPAQPGGPPSGELRPDNHGRPAGLPRPGDVGARRDANGRPVQRQWPDKPPAPVDGPGPRRDHEPGERPDAGSWLTPPARGPRPGRAFPAERPLPPAAGRPLPPATGRALPPAAGRPLPPATGRPLPPTAGRPLPPAADRAVPPAAGRAVPPAAERALSPDRLRPAESELRALPASPSSHRAPSEPALSEPALSEPALSEPALPQPALSESALPQPAPSESALPQPAPSESAPSEQARPPEASSAQPAAGVRLDRGANLSLADLERVRQALKLLSEEPAAASGQAAAPDDDHVSSSVAATPPAVASTEGGDDDADTAPLPVILPGAIEVPRPEDSETLRGPFEPARAAPSADTSAPATEATDLPAGTEPAEPADKLSAAAAEKLDQIKDLLITAEAIGEANLDRHFDRVSQRQRELIREFFDRAMPGRDPES